MSGAQKLYPRATVKKIVKAHSRRNVSKNVDVLVSSWPGRVSRELSSSSADISQLYSLFTNVCNTVILCRSQFVSVRDFELITVCRLMKEANINSKQAGERGISAKSVKKVTEVSIHLVGSVEIALTRVSRCRYRSSRAERLDCGIVVNI